MPTPQVAIIDDDADICTMLQLLLQRHGYRAVCYTSAAAGLAALKTHVPAVALVDLHLEQPNAGIAVVTALREDARTAQIPIILWSADPRVQHLAREAGADVVWTKPVASGVVVATIATLAQRP